MASAPRPLQRDQADGLRRLHATSMPSLCTVLSASPRKDKAALMQRLASRMVSRGRQVLVIDAQFSEPSQPPHDNRATGRATLCEVAFEQTTLEQAMQPLAEGVSRIALGLDRSQPFVTDSLADESQQLRMVQLLRDLAGERFRLLVDAELDASGQLPLPVLGEGELVLQVDAQPQSIPQAYAIMRALKSQCVPGMLSLLVTGASSAHARQVQANLFHAASRYLALPVRTLVPTSHARHV